MADLILMHLAKLLFSLAPSELQAVTGLIPTLYWELASHNFTLRWILCPSSPRYNLHMIESEDDFFYIVFYPLLYFVLWLCTIILINNTNIQLQFINLTMCTLLPRYKNDNMCFFVGFVSSVSSSIWWIYCYWEFQL